MKLREHQKVQQKKLFKALKKYNKVVFQAPTGWGKSINILKITHKLLTKKEFRVLIIAPRKVLVKQLLETLSTLQQHNSTPYLLMNSQKNPNCQTTLKQSQIVIASMATLIRRAKDDVGKFTHIIIDEAHTIDISKLEPYLSNTKVIGFTATPLITPKSHCAKYDYILPNKYTVAWLIDNNYLAKFDYVGKKISDSEFRNLNAHAKNKGDFDIQDIEDFTNAPTNIQSIVDSYNTYCKEKKTIIFCSSIQHAKLLQNREEFQDALVVHSKMSDVDIKNNLELFKRGEVKTILNVSMLTTGFDDTSIEALILARPTKSKMLYTQIMGRVLRYHQDIDKVLILDLVDAYETANNGLLPHQTYWDSGDVQSILKKKAILQAKFEAIEQKIYKCDSCWTEYRYIDCKRKTIQTDDIITTEYYCPNPDCNNLVDIKELELKNIEDVSENLDVLNKKVVDYSVKYTKEDVIQLVGELIKLNTQNAKTSWAVYIVKKCMQTDKNRFKELIYSYAQQCYKHKTVWKNIMQIYQR